MKAQKTHSIVVLCAALLGSTTLCPSNSFGDQAIKLGLQQRDVPQAMTEAAGRIPSQTPNLSASFSLIRCGDMVCRWDAGDGIEVTADALPGERAHRAEINWNNNRSGTSSISAAKFRRMCELLVAAIDPNKSTNAVRVIAAGIAITQGRKGKDTEKREGHIAWWGSRSIPDFKDFPSEAFVQCGATAYD